MAVPIVTKSGLISSGPNENTGMSAEECLSDPTQLTVYPDASLDGLKKRLSSLKLITIIFPTFSDGRGFSIGRWLRHMGYKGHMRASGHLISDQFRFLVECGFDDVEISEEVVARQPEQDWLENLSTDGTYRIKLAGKPPRRHS